MKSGNYNPSFPELLPLVIAKRPFLDRLNQVWRFRKKKTMNDFVLAVTEFGQWFIEKAPPKDNLNEFERFAARIATMSLSIGGKHVEELLEAIVLYSRTGKVSPVIIKDQKYKEFWEKHSDKSDD